MPRQTVGNSDEPTQADEPIPILAMAAEQLGDQAAVGAAPVPTLHQPALTDQPPPTRTTATGKQIRTVSTTWIEPVSGYNNELVPGKMNASYTHHVEGTRTRSATTVREFHHPAPGTAKTAVKTVKLNSHQRKSTRPDQNTAAITPISAHHTTER